jgi:hypothetical protein
VQPDQATNPIARENDPTVDPIASSEIICVSADGRRLRVTAQVGKPYRTPEGEWGCHAALVGLHGSLGPVRGEDSLQALSLAISLLRQLLSAFVQDGGKVLNPDDESEVPLDAILGTTTG